jgi:hypothetical protein
MSANRVPPSAVLYPSRLDRLAMWWLLRRGLLLDLKPRPLRIEFPSTLSAEEVEELREEWKRIHTRNAP